MRRIGLIVGVLVILAIVLVPSFAQGGKSITDIVENRSDSCRKFTILQEFLRVAPQIRTRLDRYGMYTLFAPNDEAFFKLESATGLLIDDLLADTELVNAILNYHIVNSRLSAQQLRQGDGRFLQTELVGSTLGIRLNVDGTIVINDIGDVIQEDIAASNGYIHVLDDVLLNSIIDEMIDARINEENTPTSSQTSSTQSQVSASIANLRFAHFSPDAPDLDFILRDEAILSENAYGVVSDFVAVPQGIYSATIESLDFNRPLEIQLDLTVLNGDFVTILVIGSYRNNSLQVIPLQEDFDELASDESRILFFNTIIGSPSVNLLLDGEVIFESVSFSEFERTEIDANRHELSIIQTRNATASLFDPRRQAFIERTFYFIVLYGTPDEPQFLLIENTLDEVLLLQSGQNVNTPENGVEATEVREGTIIEVLDNESNFTKLIRAFNINEAGDAEVVNILGNPDIAPVTFLAPTDQAFDNLLATIGYSEERFFGNAALLTDILLYHIVEEPLFAADFRNASGTSIVTRLGATQAFFVRVGSNGTIFLNGSVEILRTDIQASNGIIQVVDNVLLPQPVLDLLGL